MPNLAPSFFLAIVLLLLLLFCGPNAQQQQHQSVVARARGPALVIIPVKNGRSLGPNGLLQTNGPLVLWCHAVDARREPAEVLAADEISFTHNGIDYPAKVSDDSAQNGTLVLDQVYATFAGSWTCHVRTRHHGRVSGEISVHLRPVVFGNGSSLRIDETGNKSKALFRFEVGGMSVVRGEQARLECPVFGHPKPQIVWHKGADRRNLALNNADNGRIQLEEDGATLRIRNSSFEDADMYTCTASNSVGTGSRRTANVTVLRRLRVESELGWLFPLCMIILTVVLLVLVIVLCELRTRRKEKRTAAGGGG